MQGGYDNTNRVSLFGPQITATSLTPIDGGPQSLGGYLVCANLRLWASANKK